MGSPLLSRLKDRRGFVIDDPPRRTGPALGAPVQVHDFAVQAQIIDRKRFHCSSCCDLKLPGRDAV
jgi:hypothetical protein